MIAYALGFLWAVTLALMLAWFAAWMLGSGK